jgi:hypothetical protein
VSSPWVGPCSRCGRSIGPDTAMEQILKMDNETRRMLRVCQECDLYERQEQHGRCGICHEDVANDRALEHPICEVCHPLLVAGDTSGLPPDVASRLRTMVMTIRWYERDNLKRYPLAILPRRAD